MQYYYYAHVYDLLKFTDTKVPEELSNKMLEISNFEAIDRGNFYLIHCPEKNALILRSLTDSSYFMDDYWSHFEFGELKEFDSGDEIKRAMDEFIQNKILFFPVMSYNTVRKAATIHYPVRNLMDIHTSPFEHCCISLFVPNIHFMENNNCDADHMFEVLKNEFISYSKGKNGDIYAIQSDVYIIHPNHNFLEIRYTDDVDGYIGHEEAREALKTTDHDEFIHSEKWISDTPLKTIQNSGLIRRVKHFVSFFLK